MKYQIFLVQIVERILKKTNQSSFVYIHFSFVFSQFSLSAVFMKLVASNWLTRRCFELSEIGLLFKQISGATTNFSLTPHNTRGQKWDKKKWGVTVGFLLKNGPYKTKNTITRLIIVRM